MIVENIIGIEIIILICSFMAIGLKCTYHHLIKNILLAYFVKVKENY